MKIKKMINIEKTFHKIQYPFILGTVNKLGIEGNYLTIIKAMYEEPTTNTVLNGGRLKLLFYLVYTEQ